MIVIFWYRKISLISIIMAIDIIFSRNIAQHYAQPYNLSTNAINFACL